MVQKLIRAVVGLALVLTWWTIRGPGDGAETERADGIPTQVWGGGAGTLTIDIETSTAAQMRVSFYQESESSEPAELETYEEVAPGQHSWSIDLPADASGYVELGANAPVPGDSMSWTLRVNGTTVHEQSDTLEQALKPNYAFFLQAYFDDYATGTLGDD